MQDGRTVDGAPLLGVRPQTGGGARATRAAAAAAAEEEEEEEEEDQQQQTGQRQQRPVQLRQQQPDGGTTSTEATATTAEEDDDGGKRRDATQTQPPPKTWRTSNPWLFTSIATSMATGPATTNGDSAGHPADSHQDERSLPRSLRRRQAVRRWWIRWRALVLCLLSHTLFGLYPVLARKLTLPPPSLPAMDILFLGSTIVLLLAFPVAYRERGFALFRQRTLWIFSAVTAARAVTNIFAFKFGLAMFVQLLGLTTPFFVAVLQRLILKEPVPPRFYSSLLFTAVGTVLMLSSNLFAFDFDTMLEGTNLLGMGLALISAFFLALYMILVRLAFREKLPLSLTLTMQMLSMTVVPLLLLPVEGDVAEGFQRWGTLTAGEWAVFFTISLGIYGAGNVLAYQVLDYGGAAYNASLMGLRLVVTVVASTLLLNESFQSAWQGVGMGLVILGLAYFALGSRHAPPLVRASAPDPATSAIPMAPEPRPHGSTGSTVGPTTDMELTPLVLAGDDRADDELVTSPDDRISV